MQTGHFMKLCGPALNAIHGRRHLVDSHASICVALFGQDAKRLDMSVCRPYCATYQNCRRGSVGT